MTPEARILMEDIRGKYHELLPLLDNLKNYVTANAANDIQNADIAFATREVDNSTTEFLKKVREVHRIAAAACCISLAMSGEDVVRTEYCTATPNPKPWYKIPYKREQNPEKWDLIMGAIGVSDLANKRDLVRIHAPAFMDYCGELIGEGKSTPAGVDPKESTGMEMNLRITKHSKE